MSAAETTNTELTLSIVRHNHPGAPIEVFDDGWDHLIVVADGLAYRFTRENEARSVELTAEVEFLRRFGPRCPVAVPQLETHQQDEVEFVTYPFIGGTPLSSERFAALAPSTQEQIVAQLGSFLSALHAFPAEEARAIGIDDQHSVWSDRVATATTEILPRLPSRAARWFGTLFDRHLGLVMPEPWERRMIHGDLSLAHLILSPNGEDLAGVIDFGDMVLGDRAQDFALEAQLGDDLVKHLYESYPPEREDTFEIRRLLYESRFVLFDIYHAWGFDKRHGVGDAPPGEAERLLAAIERITVRPVP